MLKELERRGRLFIVTVVGWLLGRRRVAVCIDSAPRILVVRLDERVGNLLLLTPLLSSLRARFPAARIDVLGNIRGERLLADHPAVDEFIPFRKRAVFRSDGPLGIIGRLRRRRYDVAFEASNPTDPSATQALLTRFCGAQHTVGAARPGFGRLFSAPVVIRDVNAHEIDLRLALLEALPGVAPIRQTSMRRIGQHDVGSEVKEWMVKRVEAGRPFAIINIGARTADKMLPATAYARLALEICARGWVPVLTYGPGELQLAERVRALGEEGALPTVLAPPTNLLELGFLFQEAQCVLTCDTGPMHLAVAVGTPTLGIFVSTEPERYGYDAAPHGRVDARTAPVDVWFGEVNAWLRRATGAGSRLVSTRFGGSGCAMG